jgi:Zn-finger nucleic acid-binding protein
MELICPKCHGAMRTYERSGITVDQCSECRGIFLDRGELERLVDAETAFHARSAAGGPGPVSSPAYGSPAADRSREDRSREDRDRDVRYRDDRDRDDRYKDDPYKDDRYRSRDGYHESHNKKKRSFLEDLFD